MELLKALQLRALRHVVLDTKDREYYLRHIFRWYSKTFHTPLHIVSTLPLVDVLTAYFEERFEDMDEDERHEELVRLTETDEERRAREAAIEAEKNEADDYAARVAKEEQERVAKLQAQARAQGKIGPTDPIRPSLVDTGPQPPMLSPDLGIPDTPISKEEPLIKMDFVSDETFEELLDGHGVMSQPDKD